MILKFEHPELEHKLFFFFSFTFTFQGSDGSSGDKGEKGPKGNRVSCFFFD